MKGSDLQTIVIKRLQEVGASVFNIISASPSGCPDILAAYKGKLLALEIKGHGDTLKTHQYKALRSLYDNGAFAWVIGSPDHLELLLKAINDNEPHSLVTPKVEVPKFFI